MIPQKKPQRLNYIFFQIIRPIHLHFSKHRIFSSFMTLYFHIQYCLFHVPTSFVKLIFLIILTNFFVSVNTRHLHSTRLVSKASYDLLYARTNYKKFNVRFSGPPVGTPLTNPSKVVFFCTSWGMLLVS